MAELFTNLGSIAQKQGDYNAALDLYEQGLFLSRESGYRWSIAILLNNLGFVAQEQGDYDKARTLHEESLALRRELGEIIGVAASLIGLGAVIIRRASRELEHRAEEHQEGMVQLERAATLFGAVNRLLESTPSVLSNDDSQLYEQNLVMVQSLLDEGAFAKAWAAGRAMSPDEVINNELHV